MVTLKYVVTPRGALLFPSLIKHSEFLHLTPISAGFVTFMDEEVVVHGRSESLDLDSHEDDERIIRSALGLNKPVGEVMGMDHYGELLEAAITALEDLDQQAVGKENTFFCYAAREALRRVIDKIEGR